MKMTATGQKALVLLAAAGCFAFAIFWGGFREKEPFRLAVGTRPGSEALIFALTQDKPLSPQDLRIIEMTGATAISRALENGVVDAAVISLDEALQMNDAGHPVRLALVLEESRGADVVLAPPQITSLQMLKGKRVGAEVRSSSHYLLYKALHQAGLSLSDVELLPLTGREVAAAFQAEDVDALVVTEPDVQRFQPGEMKRLFDSNELKNPILRVLAVREAVWNQKKPVIALVAERYLKAQPSMQAGNDRFRRFLERRMRLTPDAVERCLRYVHFPNREENLVWLSGDRLDKIMEVKVRDMVASDLLSDGLSSRPVGDASLIKP